MFTVVLEFLPSLDLGDSKPSLSCVHIAFGNKHFGSDRFGAALYGAKKNFIAILFGADTLWRHFIS